jgi:hypothetical protein
MGLHRFFGKFSETYRKLPLSPTSFLMDLDPDNGIKTALSILDPNISWKTKNQEREVECTYMGLPACS